MRKENRFLCDSEYGSVMGFCDCMIVSPGSTDSGEIAVRFSRTTFSYSVLYAGLVFIVLGAVSTMGEVQNTAK